MSEELATGKVVEDVEKGTVSSSKVGAEGWVTDPVNGLTSAQVEQARSVYGANEIPVHVTPTYVLFLRQFVGFLPILIEVAAIISLAAGDYADFAIVLGILCVNAILGFREEYHAKQALDELSNSIESEITVLRDGGKAVTVPTKDLVPGDICLLVGGTVVPADVKWLRGDIMSIDTAALTGEPLPRKYPSDQYGDVMLSGTTVKAGECYGQVTAIGTMTEVGQAQADILQDKSVRIVSVFQQKIMVVVQALVLASLAIVVGVVFSLGIQYDGFQTDLKNTILDSLAIMISSIPIALPLVLQVNLALGAAHLAKKHHAIVTSIPALQDIASMSILCSDKTGTLTTANMSIITDKIYAAEGFTPDDVLMYAYLTSNPDKKDDPIDRAVVSAFSNSEKAKEKLKNCQYHQNTLIGFNPEVKRTVAFVFSGGRISATVAKGLPAKIINTEAGGIDSHEIQWKVKQYGDKNFMEQVTSIDEKLSRAGYKTIAIAICESDAREDGNHAWTFVGLLPMLDPPRHDTALTIESLHRANISVKMITGDHVNVGRETARLIGLGTDIQPGQAIRTATSEEIKKKLIWNADGFAAVLPSDKREVVLTLRNEFGVVTGMTGDGVNDAPALSAAQVGIAVEGATDAAKNAADLILTEPGLSPIYGAVIASRRIFQRIKSYVVYRIAASGILVLTLSIIIFVTGCAVDSLLVIILALLNDISMIPVAYDNADATAKPQVPDAMKLVLMSAFFGCFNTANSLIFLFSLEHSQSLKYDIDFETCTDETRGFIWLQLVFVTELMIFSTRAPNFFFQTMPSIFLIGSVLLTCVIGILIANLSKNVHGANIGWVILFNAGTFVVVDFAKVWFKDLIGESPGDIIKREDLVEEPVKPKSEVEKHMEKKMRYRVHRNSTIPVDQRSHTVEIVDEPKGCMALLKAPFTEIRYVSDGFIQTKGRFGLIPHVNAPATSTVYKEEKPQD